MIDEKLTKNLQEQITENKNDITSLKNKTTLWTNTDPDAWFGAQTITLSDNMNNYKYLMIECRNFPDRNTLYTAIIENYSKSYEIGNVFNWDGLIFVGSRRMDIPANNQLYFEGAYGYINFDPNRGYSHDDWLVPQRVIGIK